MRRGFASVLCSSLLLAGAVPAGAQPAETPALDPASGLIMADSWRLVAAHCGACHSTRLVTQNRGSRETWLAMIRWMQDSQGLWPLNPPSEQAIVDYLATWYGPMRQGRRAPLAANLMPPNSDKKN